MTEQLKEPCVIVKESCVIGTEIVEYDGHRFTPNKMMFHAYILPIVYNARRGDEGASSFLDAFRIVVVDHDGKPYWPMNELG